VQDVFGLSSIELVKAGKVERPHPSPAGCELRRFRPCYRC
jgi:hypothetical protein